MIWRPEHLSRERDIERRRWASVQKRISSDRIWGCLLLKDYLVKLKFARRIAPSFNVTISCRQVPAHPLFVFQT